MFNYDALTRGFQAAVVLLVVEKLHELCSTTFVKCPQWCVLRLIADAQRSDRPFRLDT